MGQIFSRLPKRERAFLEEYVIDQDAYRAAIACGYTHQQAREAKRWVTRLPLPANRVSRDTDGEIMNPNVSLALQEILAEKERRAGLTSKACIDELKKIAFANMKDFMDENEDGQPIIDLKGKTRDQMAAIAEVISETKTKTVTRDDETETIVTYTLKVKLWNKQEALVNLVKFFGYDSEDNTDKEAFEFTLDIGDTTVNREGPASHATIDDVIGLSAVKDS